jgi:phosphohistidine phosphatase
MKRLLLLRHAKAERAQPGEKDLDRVLTDRGRSDAARLGAYLARHGLIPDQAVVSTSARTRETYTHVAKALGKAPPALFDERIYESSPQAILDVVFETKPKSATLLVVGHNPSLQELATMLTASGDLDARRRLKEEFPTAALAVLSFAFDTWTKLHAHGGRLEHFVGPKWLEAATD